MIPKKKYRKHPPGVDRRQINVVLDQKIMDWYRKQAKTFNLRLSTYARNILVTYYDRVKPK